MTPQQQKVLDDAVKTKLNNEMILTGGNKYINPIRKSTKKKKTIETISTKELSRK